MSPETSQPILKVFDSQELRWDLYPYFQRLMKAGFEIEAYLLILSTWNFAGFRYVARTFKVDEFEETILRLEPTFAILLGKEFRTIDLKTYEKEIKQLFQTLAKIKGIQMTGAPKLMHLKVPEVFVMWDGYIRKHYGFRIGDENDYFNFLVMMQERFGKCSAPEGRTLAKAIDEHNYQTITEPALELAREQRKRRRKRSP